MDSWSLTSSGILVGNKYDLGHFDQCLESSFRTDETQYCLMVARTQEFNQSIRHGICLPKICSIHTFKQILGNIYPSLGIQEAVPKVCTSKDLAEDPIVSKAFNVFFVVFGLTVLSTMYHAISMKYCLSESKLCTSFSLVRNTTTLFGTSKGIRLGILDGLRVMAMIEVFRFHIFSKFR